jgi:hypothetical protein
MGAWGSGAFENDSALDAVDELVDGTFSFDELRDLMSVPYLEEPGGSIALALTEVALTALGRIDPPAALDEVDVRLLSSQFDGHTYDLILAAAERAVSADGSELYELWDEAGDDDLREWLTASLTSIEALRAAISD